jgi:hypothetical protein
MPTTDDPRSGNIEFERPEAKQHFVGVLVGAKRMEGAFAETYTGNFTRHAERRWERRGVHNSGTRLKMPMAARESRKGEEKIRRGAEPNFLNSSDSAPA